MSKTDFDYERCIVSIWIDGKVNGTGFVIAPGKVLTCAHVVLETDEELGCEKSRKKKIKIEFYGVPRSQNSDDLPALQPVAIDPDHFSPEAEQDIAILTWEGDLPEQVTAARFSLEEKLAGRPVRTRGFPPITPYRSQPGIGTIQGTTTHDKSGAQNWTLTSQEITGGFSGAPIFDPISGHVVAMVRAVIRPDTHWRNKETAIGIQVQTILDVCKDLIQRNETEAERGRKRQDGIAKLRAQITSILETESTRRFILRKNRLPESLTAEDLSNRLFAITPEIRKHDENHTPMCMLKRCIAPPLPTEKDRREVLAHLRCLAALIAPLSFVAENPSGIEDMVLRLVNHAKIASEQPAVGASLVAAHLGVEVDLSHREVIEDKGNWIYSGIPLDTWGKLHSGSLIPITGIEQRDFVEMVAEGLAPLLGSVNAKVEYVRASLRNLAQQGTFVCIWFKRKVNECDLEMIKTEFPDLLVLLSDSEHDSEINALVITQLVQIQKFIEANND